MVDEPVTKSETKEEESGKKTWVVVLIVAVAVLLLGYVIWGASAMGGEEEEEEMMEPVACTMDVMECPDGTFVGRVAPDCEFAECPGY